MRTCFPTATRLAAVLLMFVLAPAIQNAQQVETEERRGISRWKARDDHGNLVEYAEHARWREKTTFDVHGREVSRVLRYSDGTVSQHHFAYAIPAAAQTAQDGITSVERPSAVGTNITPDTLQSYLEKLPPLPPYTPSQRDAALGFHEPGHGDAESETPNHPWGRYVVDARGEWSRTSVDILGASMEVTALVALPDYPDWVQITDDRGGLRFDHVTETPAFGGSHGGYLPAVTSQDLVGPIVQVVTNSLGFPVETWYGETFFVRYHYPQLRASEILPERGAVGLWLEYIDARTGEVLLDSRALGRTGSVPRLEAAGGVVESFGDELFVPVRIRHGLHSHTDRYALIPLGGGVLWRSVQSWGTGEPMLWSRVDYTDSMLRVHVRLADGDLVLEAPRSGNDPVRVIHPENIDLPLQRSDSAVLDPTGPWRELGGAAQAMTCEMNKGRGKCEDEITVTGRAPPAPPVPRVEQQPPRRRPTPPPRPRSAGKAKENLAKADARERATRQSCLDFFREQNADFPLLSSLDNVKFRRDQSRCEPGDVAWVQRGDPTLTIKTCQLFYLPSTGRRVRSDAVIHELLHLAGKSHPDFGGASQFHAAVMRAC